MKTRSRVLLGILGVAIVALMGWGLFRGPSEPVYHGKSLSQWLDLYDHAGSMDKTEPASEAIRAMGTNALPFLLRNIQHNRSPMEWKLREAVGRLPLLHQLDDKNDPYRVTSVFALSVLSSNAVAICPELLQEAVDPRSSWWGETALTSIGLAANPTLANACASTNDLVRNKAVLIMAKINAKSEEVYWGWWLKPPHQSRPRLLVGNTGDDFAGVLKLLEYTNSAVRCASAEAFRRYPWPLRPPEFADAVKEALFKALGDTNSEVRISAGQALKSIDPEAAAKAGVK